MYRQPKTKAFILPAGFTLVELMIVVAVIGILAAVALRSPAEVQARAEMTNIRNAVITAVRRAQAVAATSKLPVVVRINDTIPHTLEVFYWDDLNDNNIWDDATETRQTIESVSIENYRSGSGTVQLMPTLAGFPVGYGCNNGDTNPDPRTGVFLPIGWLWDTNDNPCQYTILLRTAFNDLESIIQIAPSGQVRYQDSF